MKKSKYVCRICGKQSFDEFIMYSHILDNHSEDEITFCCMDFIDINLDEVDEDHRYD